MCYNLEEIQQIIDNAYEGDIKEALKHINTCPRCKEKYERLKNEDKVIEDILQQDMKIPPIKSNNVCKVDFKKKNKRRIFNMNKRTKKWVSIAAGVAICGGLLFVEPVRARAEEFLKMFRAQKIESISIKQSDIREIEELFSKGEGAKNIEDIVKINVDSQGKEISLDSPRDVNEIKQKMSVDKVPELPKGFVYSHISKIPKTNVTIKLDVDKANDFLNYVGEKIKLPKSLDKKTFTINLDQVVYYDLVKKDSGKDDNQYIGICKMKSPTLEIPKDVDEKQLIKTLFSMNILPRNLKSQFMNIDDLTSTLPIPYDAEHQIKKEISIDGQKALLIKEKNSNYSNVYFKDKENLYVVNGEGDVKELISFIEGMK